LRPLRFLADAPSAPGGLLLSPEAAYVTLQMLSAHDRPDQGFAPDWTRDDLGVAWKTGTSWGFRDAWSIGVVGPYVVAVWVGNFDSRGNPAFVSRRAAAPLMFEIIEALRPRLQGYPPPDQRGLHLAQVEVCAVSGMLPNAHCPHTTKTLFIPGRSPFAPCTVHQEYFVRRDNGKLACPGDEALASPRVFERWESRLSELFKRAGMPRQSPPPFDARCGEVETQARAGRGRPPIITSPQREVSYNLRASDPTHGSIPFSASVDADAHALTWFVDDEPVGHAKPNETFFWRAKPGAFVVRAVDDAGRAAASDLRVVMVP
jgi:penicillin-binding protein 1C